MAAQCAAIALLAFGGVACDDDTATDDPNVQPADAYTAIVEWQVGVQEPVIDESGEVVLPVVYVVADDGSTIDVGVQADVAAATADWATVRFADDPTDTFDPDVEGEPVRDDGVMLLTGPLPDASPSIDVSVVRYVAVDDSATFIVEVTATQGPSNTSAVSPRATVTSVMQQ